MLSLFADMLHKVYRPRPEPPARCVTQNRFIFNWRSIADDQHVHEQGLPVQRAIIRAYLKPISRLLKKDPTPVDIDIRVGLLGEESSFKAGTERVEVTTSTSWLELDVTRGVQSLWPSQTQNYNLEFTINLSVNCKDTKKVPAMFIDPTEIKLSNARRRQRYEPYQPLFLVFFSDAEIKEIVRNETLPISNPLTDYSEGFPEGNTGERERRSTPTCTTGDYPVIFDDLHLNYVIVPHMYNARQCAGSCSHHVLTEHHQLGTNHANIMAGAYNVFSAGHTGGSVSAPQEPCCVPTRYSSLAMIVLVPVGDAQTLEYKIYPAMKVEECGCR